MFENLQSKLESALKRLRGQSKITEENIQEALAEVRNALLDADVNFSIAKEFIETVQVKALGLEVKGNILPGQMIVKLIHDELVELMGKGKSEINFNSSPPTVIMVAGLQGSGKTTFCGKLALYLKKKGRQPLLVAGDIYRPAAVDQLKMLGQQISVPVYFSEGKNPVEISKESLGYARNYARDIIIIDTAGRLTIDEQMMQEIEQIKIETKPREILFVCDAMTGQDAVNTAKAFHDRLSLTGVVLTKLDGDTRGGAALSIKKVVGQPIKFVGVGEKVEALEQFHPDRIASRILGMGDIITLVEKAQQEIDDKEAERLEEKIRKNQFTLQDFLEQLRVIKKMGSLKDLLGMIPGMDRAMQNVQLDDKAFGKVEAIILSMTKEERNNPRILGGSRKRRIALGSGSSISDVNRLLTQFEDMQKMMKNMSQSQNNPMQKLRGMKMPNFKIPTGFRR
jgi:signal recognition particle subunit SRP54